MAAARDILADYESGPNAPIGLPTSHSIDPTSKKIEDEKTAYAADTQVYVGVEVDYNDEYEEPTQEELDTLRRVSAPMSWAAIAMCITELAERASYYGCSGLFGNFVRRPLPPGGNGAGAVAKGAAGLNQSAGALGLGTQVSSAMTTSFKFLAYVMPLFGAVVADTKWGRFKTIFVGIVVGFFAHVLLVIPAIPSVIAGGKAIAPFAIAVFTLALAAGFIKPSLGPLLCDQSPVSRPMVKVLPSGERVIVDPQVTIQRYLMIFYWCINVGAFFQVATSYAERYVGFWLAFATPGIAYLVCPIVLVLVHKKLYRAPPQGSVFLETVSVIKTVLKNGGWKQVGKGPAFWEPAKPSFILARDGAIDQKRISWDDEFVEEIKQTIKACAVFALIPIFNLGDGGLGDAEGAMSSAMRVDGVPNDVISNFNPLTIIVMAPILNYVIYPFFEKMKMPLKPMTRMCIGFLLCSLNMIYGAVLQWRVYKTSPCGYYASTCEGVSPISLWAQIPLYSLPAIGELLVNVTSYELAYTRAPARMKGLVWAIQLFMTAVSAAISLALSAVVVDPHLIWSYVALAVANFACALAFPTYFRNLNETTVISDHSRMEGKINEVNVISEKESAAKAQ